VIYRVIFRSPDRQITRSQMSAHSCFCRLGLERREFLFEIVEAADGVVVWS
jgi:hypothetical protein